MQNAFILTELSYFITKIVMYTGLRGFREYLCKMSLYWPPCSTVVNMYRIKPEESYIVSCRNEMNRALGHLCAHIG